jgi:hypothetical protein
LAERAHEEALARPLNFPISYSDERADPFFSASFLQLLAEPSFLGCASGQHPFAATPHFQRISANCYGRPNPRWREALYRLTLISADRRAALGQL